MTDNVETPSNNNVQINKKTLKWVGIVIGAIVVLAIIGGGSDSKSPKSSSNNYTPDTSYVAPTTVDNTAAWVTWKNGYLPTWQSFTSDYQTTVDALTNGDVTGASSGFLSMSNDAVAMMQWDNSPSASINYDVETLAADINKMCAEGSQSLINISNGGGPTYGFQDSVTAVKDDISTMTTDLQNVNNGSY